MKDFTPENMQGSKNYEHQYQRDNRRPNVEDPQTEMYSEYRAPGILILI